MGCRLEIGSSRPGVRRGAAQGGGTVPRRNYANGDGILGLPETESGPRTAKHINMHVDQGAVTIGILALLATVIRAPLFPTGIAFLIMLVAFSAIWGRVIPTRVGVTVDGLELQAPLRRVRLSWDDIESGVFIVDEKNGTRPSR